MRGLPGAFLGERLVGYLRLRHGEFRVNCPPPQSYEDCFGPSVVLSAQPDGDGCFEEHEQAKYLTLAKRRIAERLVLEG